MTTGDLFNPNYDEPLPVDPPIGGALPSPSLDDEPDDFPHLRAKQQDAQADAYFEHIHNQNPQE